MTTPAWSFARRSSRRGGTILPRARKTIGGAVVLALVFAGLSLGLSASPASAASTPTPTPAVTETIAPTTTPQATPTPQTSRAPLATPTPAATTVPSEELEEQPAEQITPTPSPSQEPAPTTPPSPSPAPEPEPDPEPIVITSPTNRSFVSGLTVTLAGTKQAGSAVTIPSVTGGRDLCNIAANESTTWTCANLTLPSGTIGLAAQQTTASGATNESAPIALRVLGSPGITGTGTLVNAGSLDGVGWDGASIRVTVSSPSARTESCAGVVTDGYWYCGLDLASGTYQVQVEQSWPGSSNEWSTPSSQRTLVIDRDVPAAPVVSSPEAGENLPNRAVRYTGSGENQASVDVYLDDQPACSAIVSNGAWSCDGAAPGNGSHSVKAIQRDVADNVSPPSTAVRFSIGATVSPSPTPTSSSSPSAPASSSSPTAPSSSPSTTPSTPASPVSPVTPPTNAAPQPVTPPTPAETAPAAPTPAPPTPEATFPPFLSAPPGGDSGLAPEQTWGTPTLYGAAISSPQQTFDRGDWMAGALIALGWLLLIALPLRLLATTLRDRVPKGNTHLTGRNRLSTERRLAEERLPGFSAHPAVVAVGALLGATVLAVLASGIQNEARYLRLTAAVAVGLAILNICVALSTRIAGRATHVAVNFRLVPLFLAVGATTAVISRVAGIQPPLIVGVVIGVAFAGGIAAHSRGAIQLAQIGAMTVLATGAWLALGALGALGAADGFWPSALNEMLSAICLAGLGSALLLLLPVLSLPGRAILEWSPVSWLVATVTVASLAAVILTGEHFPVVLAAGGAAVITVLSLATWGWIRFVEPASAT